MYSKQQINDFVGPKLDVIAKQMAQGISEQDMDDAIELVIELLCEKVYNKSGIPLDKSNLPIYKPCCVCGGCCHD